MGGSPRPEYMKFQMDREKAPLPFARLPLPSPNGAAPLQDRFVILACDGRADMFECKVGLVLHGVVKLAADLLPGFWNAWTAAEALEYTHSLVANEEGGRLACNTGNADLSSPVAARPRGA